MQKRTIINALAQVRADAMRDGTPGRDEAEALLKLYGVDPDSLLVRKKYNRRHGRGELQREILRALRNGPMTAREITAAVYRSNDVEAVNASVKVILNGLKKRGVVRHEGRRWELD